MSITASLPDPSFLSTTVRVFLDELPWDVRSYNTDGRYVREALPHIVRYQPEVSFIQQRSIWLALRENAKLLRAALGRRVGFPLTLEKELTSRLAAGELARSGAQVVFSHRAFPVNAGDVPVVWQQAILDPAMQRSYGASEAMLKEEKTVKGALFRRAALVQVSTQAEARRHAAEFPDIAERFLAVPFFTPHVGPCPEAALARHLEPGPVRLLFVGGQAWRKGLDLLLEAFAALPASTQKRATLTIISNFERSGIRVPKSDRISVLRGAGVSRVLEEMRRAHVFINVARFESYGLVFHEAISQGLACLAPDWEVQRELLDDGRAGLLLRPQVAAVRDALEELMADPQVRYQLGLAAWTRFRERYAPAVVAEQYAELFRRAAQGSDGDALCVTSEAVT